MNGVTKSTLTEEGMLVRMYRSAWEAKPAAWMGQRRVLAKGH
jgi:hypothetical protein